MRISDWSSDVCSSDLHTADRRRKRGTHECCRAIAPADRAWPALTPRCLAGASKGWPYLTRADGPPHRHPTPPHRGGAADRPGLPRSEAHTSENQSQNRISYAAFYLKKKTKKHKKKYI